jgi:hypothetical protein
MALLGMLLLLLFGALRLGSRGWDAGEKTLARTADLGVGSKFIQGLFNQIRPTRWTGAEGRRLAFDGGMDGLRFIGMVPGQQGISGLRLVSLAVESTDEGRGLALRWAIPRAGTQDFQALDEAASRVVLDGLAEVSFAYFGAGDGPSSAQWLDHWSSTTRLPDLIRVRVVDKDGKAWPEIVAAPMIGTGCDWDDSFQNCLGAPDEVDEAPALAKAPT